MKKPKSNIPYVVGVVAPNEIYWNFSTIKLAELRFEEDAAYIVEACNNFPKAVELLNDLKKFCDIVATGRELDEYAWRKSNELKLQYDKFLKKIEE